METEKTNGNEGLKGVESIVGNPMVDTVEYCPWMVVERHPCQNVKETRKTVGKFLVNSEGGLRFKVLSMKTNEKGENEDLRVDFSGLTFKKCDFLKKFERGNVKKKGNVNVLLDKEKVGRRSLIGLGKQAKKLFVSKLGC